MLREEIRVITSSKQDLRNFGVVFGAAAGLLGAYWWRRGSPNAVWIFGLGIVFLFIAFVFPRMLQPLRKTWMVFGYVMGWGVTRIVLSLFFYGFFFAVGLILRVFKKHPLDLKARKDSNVTYWAVRDRRAKDSEDLTRQF